MSCEDREKQLPAYLEGDLSSMEMEELRDHLASCENCRKALEDLKKTNRLVRDLAEVSPPPWLKSQIMARVREEAGEKRGWLRKVFFPLYIKIPVQAFAVVVISVFAFYLYRQDAPQMRMKGIPLPSAPVFETTREPASPPSQGEPQKRSVAPKRTVRSGQEMPEASTVRSDEGASLVSSAPDEKTPERGTIAADDVAVENPPAFPEPVPPAVPQALGGEVKGAFSSPVKQKNGEARPATTFPREKNGVCEPDEELCRYEAKVEDVERSLTKETRMTGTETTLEWVLSVQDAVAAATELEDYGGKVGLRYIEAAVRGGQHVFTAEIRPSYISVFREKLHTLGQVSADKEPEIAKDIQWVRIQIILVPSARNKP